MVSLEPQDGMTCRQAQLLMILHMNDDPDLTQEDREAFNGHLLACQACVAQYEQRKWRMPLAKRRWDLISQAPQRLRLAEPRQRSPPLGPMHKCELHLTNFHVSTSI